MKTAKRVLAILMAMLMAVSAFAVAASAAESLQSKINAAAAGDTVSISVNTKESVTVSKNLTIDLGGKILKGVAGKSAITVKDGAKVTITNGYVEAYTKGYSGGSAAIDVLTTAGAFPSAITAYGTGTEVTLDDVRAMGGLFRIPTVKDYYVPLGSALKLYNSANAVLNNAVLIGSYAVSNDPKNLGRADGKVTVNDAILIGFIDYVKRATKGVGLDYDEETVEKVNAADRIVGFLNNGINLTENELYVLKKVMDDRAYIFTTKPTDDKAIVTINHETGWAKIEAAEVKDLKVTDCSYKYIPENAYDVETGKKYALDTDIPAAELEGKEIRINYRLAFELKGDVKKFCNNFDHYFHVAYDKLFEVLDEGVERALDFYEYEIQQLANIYTELDNGSVKPITIGNVTTTALEVLEEEGKVDEFYAIERAILALGGIKLYEKTAAGADGFTTLKFNQPLYANGEKKPAEGTYKTGASWTQIDDYEYDEETQTMQPIEIEVAEVIELGTLDKVDAMVKEFLALDDDGNYNGELNDQTKWAAKVQYVVNHYDEVLALVDEVAEKLADLKAAVSGGTIGEIIEKIGMKSKLKMLDELIDNVAKAQEYIELAKNHEIVSKMLDIVDSHVTEDDAMIDATVAEYTAKVVRALNDYTVYFTPENFLLENGNFGKTYIVDGPTQVKVIERGKLHVRAYGGKVLFTSDTLEDPAPATNSNFVSVPYADSVTLTAVPAEGKEFMYYVNTDTDRILSTNPVITLDTQIDRYVDAIFESTDNAKVVFTNHSGVLCGEAAYAESVDASAVDTPTFTGYTVVGWGPKGASTLSAGDYVSAYAKGSSAFEMGATYNDRGYAFKLNTTTANKYLATPKYEAQSEFAIYFNDNGNRVGNDKVKIGNPITYTATGEGFSYWATDAEGENPVSLYATYKVIAHADAEFYAIYNKEVPVDNADAVLSIQTSIDEGDLYRVYGERSIASSREIVSTGFILSFTDSIPAPEVTDYDNNNVKMTFSSSKEKQGVLSVGIRKSTINNYADGVCYVRTFVELKTATGSEYAYSAPIIIE